MAQLIKNPPAIQDTASNAGDSSSIPWSGRFPGEGNGNSPQDPCLGNRMHGEAWWAAVPPVTESWTQFSN